MAAPKASGPVQEDLDLFDEIDRAIRGSPETFRRGDRYLSRYSATAFWEQRLSKTDQEDDLQVSALWPLERLERAARELTELARSSAHLKDEAAFAICIVLWILAHPKAHEFDPLLTELQSLPWMEEGAPAVWRSRACAECPPGLVVAARRAVDHLKATGAWPEIGDVPLNVTPVATEKVTPKPTRKKRRRFKRDELDGAAAKLARKHPSWTKKDIAHELDVSPSALSDRRRPLPTLELVLGQRDTERLEQRDKLASPERRDSLRDDT